MSASLQDKVGLHDLAEEWLETCEAEGKRPSTMRSYRWSIMKTLLPWAEREGIGDLADLDQQALNRLNQELLSRTGNGGEPISKHAVDTYLRPIRNFLGWAKREGYDVRGRPLSLRKGRRRPKDVLTREEIQSMEDACPNERDKLIIRLLADTGMRINEALELRPRDLIERQRQWFVYVQGKGQNDRIVGIPRLNVRLRRWVERGRPQPCADRIFVTLRGSGYYPALKYAGAYAVVVNAAMGAGIQKPAHPHLLRHSFITHLRRKGYNDGQVSMIVGNHTALDGYTHLEAADVYGVLASLE